MPPSIPVPVANKGLVRLMKESPVSGWDDAWKIGLTPWDSGDIQPALRDLILFNELDLPKAGRALVPGCGRGYDAAFIASHLGLDALAIDISPTAVQAARENPSAISGASVTFEATDFFELSVPDGQHFNLIYDHTFFVAIPPVRRCDWGKQISALLKPGGYLVTLVFPLNLPVDEDGPPFFVKPEHYAEVLGEGWEKVLDKAPENSIPERRSLTNLRTATNPRLPWLHRCLLHFATTAPASSIVEPGLAAESSSDAIRDRKLCSLGTALSQEDSDSSAVWARYVDFGTLDYSGLPLEIHQKVLRKCVPQPSVLRPFAAKRMQGPPPPRTPHLYEARLKAVMRNIRSIAQKPSLDDYNYVLEQFAAVGHPYGSMDVYDELRHAVKLQPDTRTFRLTLQSIAHRLTLPMYKSRRAKIQSDCAAFCKALLNDMSSFGIPFTPAILDLAMRISKETADQDMFSQLLKLVYGIDLDFPDHLPIQWDHNATVEAGIPQLPNFQPFSTAALNTTIDMVGRSGNVSKLVQAFEVLTQPLPPQASQHHSLEFDDEDDFGVVNPASTQPHQTPHAKPNSTTYHLLLKHLSRANHSTLARHYLFQAFQLERVVDRAVRTHIYHTPYKTPAPQFATNRHMLLSVFGTAKRNKDMQLMRFVGYIARQTYRRKKNDITYYSELRELQRQGRQPLAADHDPSHPNSSELQVAHVDVLPPFPDAADATTSIPLIPPELSPPVKYFDVAVHLDILQKDFENIANFYTQEFLPGLARKTQRVKERLGRRRVVDLLSHVKIGQKWLTFSKTGRQMVRVSLWRKVLGKYSQGNQ
ncbi:hypothetical protein L210DRAFT_3500099 [Boletus edulis BED1]|uniref:S-adenosyl-L-methionine-dependent methyltransferase n=1 Tax=Boletus edulis BED1 TaxID=1328754 RepID=A0AAD4C760_BOLED|nr:hypothetical protein L210DRAFT_3500099 [Boletus edulis BED1]